MFGHTDPKLHDVPIGIDATGQRKEFDSIGTVDGNSGVGNSGVREFRCQSIFSRGGRPRRRGSRTMPRRWEMTSTQSSAP